MNSGSVRHARQVLCPLTFQTHHSNLPNYSLIPTHLHLPTWGEPKGSTGPFLAVSRQPMGSLGGSFAGQLQPSSQEIPPHNCGSWLSHTSMHDSQSTEPFWDCLDTTVLRLHGVSLRLKGPSCSFQTQCHFLPRLDQGSHRTVSSQGLRVRVEQLQPLGTSYRPPEGKSCKILIVTNPHLRQ